ncbi:7-deoxyloganetin glucosyltransferase-like [Rosa rugosa]|uniref:7-deoxyloganetin glucosyltransferase-like n=1 Tax=Rosa rugosa TaxID=74645 RepID=UPI002B40AC7C|nr:7-deoxyloganetin glucosyltransferase-like [Rosa rugosa]
MDSIALTHKPHAVCIPFPAQGHINPVLKLAKLLHHKGFYLTFVNTEYNHKRLLKFRGLISLDGLPSFTFKTIPDGLPPTDADATQDIASLCVSTRTKCLSYFKELLSKLNSTPNIPPVSCIIVSDGVMNFTVEAAQELGLPEILFWTTSACGFMAYMQYQNLIDEGLIPLKDASCLTNGYLETEIDWLSGMRGVRLSKLVVYGKEEVQVHKGDRTMTYESILYSMGQPKKKTFRILIASWSRKFYAGDANEYLKEMTKHRILIELKRILVSSNSSIKES